VEALLDAGADAAATNDAGETPLLLAEREDDLVIVERLRDAVG
jgi:ankyrin repeat protein